MEPTERQLDFIREIEDRAGVRFTGSTKEQARQFISDHIEEYELNTISDWALSNGYF